MDEDQEIKIIPWKKIRPMPGQPREYFDQGKLKELANSITAVGQIIPVQVVPLSKNKLYSHELIDGQRRWLAVQLAGIENLRCEVIVEPDEEVRYVRSVVANLARETHTHLEIMVVCDRLRRTNTIQQVADLLGKSLGYVDQHLNLLKLKPEIRQLLHPSTPHSKRIPMGTALAIAKYDRTQQDEVLNRIMASSASRLKATKEIVSELSPKSDVVVRPYDKFRDLRHSLNRAASSLESYDDSTLSRITKQRSQFDLQRAQLALSRVEVEVERIKKMIQGHIVCEQKI